MSSDTLTILTAVSVLIGQTLSHFAIKSKVDKMDEKVKKVIKWQKRKDCKSVKIYVLDDDRDDLFFIEEILLKIGNPYELFSNEGEFLRKIPNVKSVFIIDHFINSRTSGLSIVEKIIKTNTENFVIAFTGTKNNQVIGEYVSKGIKRYISKQNEDLYKLLEEAVIAGIEAVAESEN